MTRTEHLQWCKDRAIHYIDNNNLEEAHASFLSDMRKHKELTGHIALELGFMLMFGGHLDTQQKMRKWINGFN